ncbi:MAG: 4Fe-4S dicluster domain-containing protein [Bdellovibrionales bacterium]|nr:4Fe-4S dicluster domain-containing protein [Bdellovibrionales bacterium]
MPYQVLNTCTLCGACLPECPTDSIVTGPTQVFIDTDTCADHAACVAVCPVKAIVPLRKLRNESKE